MDITVTREDRQAADWLATGKFALGLFVTGIPEAKTQGLPVDEFRDANFKEPPSLDTGANGTFVLLKQAPHPNAAKVFINWFLSREGQRVYQKVFAEGGTSGGNSMRDDIPKDEVRADVQRTQGVKFLFTGLPEWIEMKPIHGLIQKVLTEAKKN